MRTPGHKAARGERPDRPFTGFKLAHAMASADGASTAFTGLTLGAGRVYGVIAEASCVWNRRHVTPRRWCGCGFYCLHELADARALGCATENRSALLLEVTASGRYIRYERGLRYSRQRVLAIRGSWCDCGRPGTGLTDAGSGIVGWRQLTPVCAPCAAGRPVLLMAEFAARLDGPVRVEPAPAAAAGAEGADTRTDAIAVLTAEIALLHARLDDLQSRLDR
ncbi:hypothetical protein [Trebonia sp.]|uniref:hypothetical protein n=1 Tax=Trebonia sp. TaxID=2767075 RepID=UPI002633C487|nr:hypothetical protein [Trebonia sp.]